MSLSKTILGLLFICSTAAMAAPKGKLKTIVCTETRGSESEGDTDGDGQVLQVGKYVITLNEKNQVTEILLDRKEMPTVSPIHLILNNQNAKFKHDKRPNVKEFAETWGIKEIEAVEASLKNTKDKLLIRINDHSYAGPVGSTILFAFNGKELEASGDTTMFCKGDVMFPANQHLDDSELK